MPSEAGGFIKSIVYSSPEELGLAAARLFIAELREARTLHKRPVMLLPTGGTVVPLYRKLIELWREEALDLSDVVFFNLDEYVGLAREHPASFHSFMWANFYGFIVGHPNGPQASAVHLPDGSELAKAEEVAAAYGSLLASYLESADSHLVCFAGIGAGPAHIAFNDFTGELAAIPEAERLRYALQTPTRLVHLDEKTRQANARFFAGGLAEVPFRAITVGFREILQCARIVVMASDATKRQALVSVFAKEPRYSVPASLLRRHPAENVLFLLSAEAYSPDLAGAVSFARPELLRACEELFGAEARLVVSQTNASLEPTLPRLDLKRYRRTLLVGTACVEAQAVTDHLTGEVSQTELAGNALQELMVELKPELVIAPYARLSLEPELRTSLRTQCKPPPQLLVYEDRASRLMRGEWAVLLSASQLARQKRAVELHLSQIRRSPLAAIAMAKARETLGDLSEADRLGGADTCFAGAELYAIWHRGSDGWCRPRQRSSVFPGDELPFGRGDELLFISPHPDDVEIGMGGLLLHLAVLKRPVTVANATGGEHAPIQIADILAHPHPHPGLLTAIAQNTWSGEATLAEPSLKRLARHHESASALAALHPSVEVLGLNLPFYDNGYLVSAADRSRVGELLKRYGCRQTPLWLALPHPLDAHPCHRATTALFLEELDTFARQTKRPCRVLFYGTPWSGVGAAYLDTSAGLASQALIACERLLKLGSAAHELVEAGIFKSGRALALAFYEPPA